ncbi:MAG TPA: peptide chain release factor N(5)-glutamine methyltransferase [Rhodanobacteraceae bacterium]|nr:peptide chain release factor N(5)-glutamine methyltransferase [Rhodanobacteraceae bacterium]
MDPTFATLRDRLAAGTTMLPDKPEETPEASLRALWLAAAGRPMSVVAAASADLPPLDDAGLARLGELVERRIAGIPLAHLTGRQRFLDLELLAGAEALVPRRETELLARAAIELARGIDAPTVVDVCTGSGNVALALARHVPGARVFGADLSEEALVLARRNADLLGLAVEFRQGDLLAPFDSAAFLGRVDLLTCNPPYISSSKVGQMAEEIAGHEPRLAFDGGPLGVTILMRLVQQAPRFVKPGGWLAFEVGLGQGPALVRRLKGNVAYRDVRELADENGAVRAILVCC